MASLEIVKQRASGEAFFKQRLTEHQTRGTIARFSGICQAVRVQKSKTSKKERLDDVDY
jgi:hypothetical protein